MDQSQRAQSLTSSHSQESGCSQSQSQGFVAKSNHLSLVLESRINGWDKRLFAEEINLDFVCILCDGVCKQATELNCDSAHIFCEDCIREYLAQHPLCCPQCEQQKSILYTQSQVGNVVVGNELSSNTKNTLSTHTATTTTTTTPTIDASNNNSTFSVPTTSSRTTPLQMNQNSYVRKKVANLQVICPRSMAYRAKMKKEKEETLTKEMQNLHINEEENDNCCLWQGKLSELEEHLKGECKHRYQKCPFGCDVEQTQRKMNTHCNKEYLHHIDLLLNEVKTLKGQMKIQYDQIQALGMENNDLKTIVAMLAEDKQNNTFNWTSPTDNDTNNFNDEEDDVKNGYDFGFRGSNMKIGDWNRKKKKKKFNWSTDNNFAFSSDINQSEKSKTSAFEWDFNSNHDSIGGKMESNSENTWENCWKDNFGSGNETKNTSLLDFKWDTSFRKDGVDLQIPWNEKFQINEEIISTDELETLQFESLTWWDEIGWATSCINSEITLIKHKGSKKLKIKVLDKDIVFKETQLFLQTPQKIRRKKNTVEWLADLSISASSHASVKFSIQFRNSQATDLFEKELSIATEHEVIFD